MLVILVAKSFIGCYFGAILFHQVPSKKDGTEHKTNANKKPDTSSNKPTNLLQNDDEKDEESKRKQTKEKYRFLFSGLTAQEKITYGAVVEKLGGEFLEVQYFTTQCTHVIVNAPSR